MDTPAVPSVRPPAELPVTLVKFTDYNVSDLILMQLVRSVGSVGNIMISTGFVKWRTETVY